MKSFLRRDLALNTLLVCLTDILAILYIKNKIAHNTKSACIKIWIEYITPQNVVLPPPHLPHTVPLFVKGCRLSQFGLTTAILIFIRMFWFDVLVTWKGKKGRRVSFVPIKLNYTSPLIKCDFKDFQIWRAKLTPPPPPPPP